MNYSTCLINIKSTIVRTSLLLVLTVVATVSAADFGVGNWGMSTEQVKQLETRTNLTPFGEDNYLVFIVTLPGIQQARLVYQFKNDQLVEGRFIFKANNSLDVATYLDQYQVVKELISKQYGPPNSDQILTLDPMTTALNSAEYANELASDRLILKSSWQSPTALIRHQLAWKFDHPHHQLHYLPLNSSAAITNTDAF